MKTTFSKTAAKTVSILAAMVGTWALAGCHSSEEQQMKHPHYNTDEIQHLYDSGQINYQEYYDMMKSNNASWTPQSPPPPPQKPVF